MRPLLRAALASTLLATLAMALWPDADLPTVQALAPARRAPALHTAAPATPPAATATTAGAAAATAPASLLPTRAADWPAVSAAALATWQGAPPAPAPSSATRRAALAASVAASRPPAPVFPYRWIGQLDDGGPPQLLLASAQRSVGVRLGATLDGRWRLQRSASGQLLAQALPDGEAVPVPGAPAAPTALP